MQRVRRDLSEVTLRQKQHQDPSVGESDSPSTAQPVLSPLYPWLQEDRVRGGEPREALPKE